MLNEASQYLYYRDGNPLSGWQFIDGAHYYFNPGGALQTGWVKDSDNWRCYDGSRPLVGWRDIGRDENSKRYYFTADAMMVSGQWLQIDGQWYYFGADGSLAVSTTIDGFAVDENGARIIE